MLQERERGLIPLDGVKNALSAAQKSIQAISDNPGIDPDEMRQLIDAIYLQMIDMAKQGNEMLKLLEEQ